MKAADFPGTGNMTEFLKLVVRNRLEQLDIDPANYISKDFTEKKKKNRQKKRGKSFPTAVSTEGTAVIASETNVEEAEEDETIIGKEVNESEGRSRQQNDDASHVSITNVSNISQILASNNIHLDTTSETNLLLNHNFLPNTSSLSEPVPDANSTLSREVTSPPPTNPPTSGPTCPPASQPVSPPAPTLGPSSRPNIVASACFQPRRKRPADLNEQPTKQKRRTPPPSSHVMLRRSSRSGSSAGNIQKTLIVNVGHPRSVETIMFIPRNLGECFHSACTQQADQGLEMGGILAGKFDELEQSYQVTHLVIPHQKASPVCWIVEDSRQLNNFFITHPDLLLLGFVHSQPEKGPLTSFDLHSLWTYAKLNPAFVSVVYF